MGVGGGFIMVPAMIYLLGMPTAVVIGTSLFQIIFVTANVTFLQAYAEPDRRHRAGDAAAGRRRGRGAVRGARSAPQLRGEQLRALLALIVLAVGVSLAGRPRSARRRTVFTVRSAEEPGNQ